MPPQSSVSAIIKSTSSSRLASSTASRLCRTHHIRSVRPISQVSRSLLDSSKKVARVGSIPKDRPHCSRTDPAIVDEADKPIPALEHVVDRLGDRGRARQAGALLTQPCLQGG